MKFVWVTVTPPVREFGSGDTQARWLIDYFVSRGHHISMVYLERPTYVDLSVPYTQQQRNQDCQDLLKLGIKEVHTVPNAGIPQLPPRQSSLLKRIITAINYRLEFNRLEKEISCKLCEKVDTLQGDVCLWYIDSIRYFRHPIKMKSTTYLDNCGRPQTKIKIDLGVQKIFGSTLLAKLQYPIHLFFLDRRLQRRLQYCENAFVAPKYFANLWRHVIKATPQVYAVPFATADLSKYITRKDPFEPPVDKPFRVMLFGALSNAHGIPGLFHLIDEIMPALKRRGLEDAYEFVHMGDKSIYPELADKVYNSGIKFEGFIDEDQFGPALNDAHIILLPVPVPPGTGSRIQAACAASSCVVVHQTIEDCYPEIENGRNCLVATTGDQFVDQFERIRQDPSLSRKLRQNARQTFQDFYRLELGGRAFERILEETANGNISRNNQLSPDHFLSDATG